MKITTKIDTASSLIPVPHKKPRNDHQAIINALLKSEPSLISSPINAPRKDPKIIPGGPRQKPIMVPIVAPQVPYFDACCFFVRRTGRMLSKIVTMIATIAQTIKIQRGIWHDTVK